MMKIDLSLIDCVGVIIKDNNSPVIYSNQTGGTVCFHPEQKGYFLPIPETSWIGDLYDIDFLYEDEKLNNNNIAVEKIEEILSSYHLHDFILVDKNKLKESYEAWVHVVIIPKKEIIESSEEKLYGILTWPNSD
jgi:hypothetical protein